MAITLATGEALVGEGNEVAHIDLLIGSKGGPVGVAFAKSTIADQARQPRPRAPNRSHHYPEK